MKTQMKAYVHLDNYEDMEIIWNDLSSKAKAEYGNDVENFLNLVGRPLYEVELVCELDTTTHKVTVKKANIV